MCGRVATRFYGCFRLFLPPSRQRSLSAARNVLICRTRTEICANASTIWSERPSNEKRLGSVDKLRPDADASEQDESREAGGELVISGGDAALLLEMPNEALNP